MSSSSSFNDEDILLAVVAHEYQRTEKSMWVHEIKFKRGDVGEYFHLFPDLLYSKKKFVKYFRTLSDKFFKIAELLPLKKKDTHYCKPISPAERLAVTPPFLTERNHSPPSPFGISQNLPRWAWKFGTLAFDVMRRAPSDQLCGVS